MAQPEKGHMPAAAARDLRSWTGRLIGVALIVGGLFVGTYSAGQVVHAIGLRGDHGTLTVQECRVHYTSSHTARRHRTTRHVECSGTFRSDRGPITARDAGVETDTERAPGTRLPVQRTDRGFVLSGWEHAWLNIAFTFSCLLGVLAGLFSLLTGVYVGRRPGPATARAWRSLPTALRRALAGAALLALTGVGTSLLLHFSAS